MMDRLALSGIVWPSAVIFQKAFSTLKLSQEQKTLVRAMLEAGGKVESVDELKRIAVKLFDNDAQPIDEVPQ